MHITLKLKQNCLKVSELLTCTAKKTQKIEFGEFPTNSDCQRSNPTLYATKSTKPEQPKQYSQDVEVDYIYVLLIKQVCLSSLTIFVSSRLT